MKSTSRFKAHLISSHLKFFTFDLKFSENSNFHNFFGILVKVLIVIYSVHSDHIEVKEGCLTQEEFNEVEIGTNWLTLHYKVNT